MCLLHTNFEPILLSGRSSVNPDCEVCAINGLGLYLINAKIKGGKTNNAQLPSLIKSAL
jgi:hypothetical protein